MRYDEYLDLIIANVVSIIVIIMVLAVPTNTARLAISFPAVLFFPGYSLLAAIYVRNSSLKPMDRFLLSIAVSVVVVPLIGLILNYSHIGLEVGPVIGALFGFILVMSAIAYFRRSRTLEDDRFYIPYNIIIYERLDRLVKTGLILILIAVVIGVTWYRISLPRTEELYTEFYMLGHEGSEHEYPSRVFTGIEYGLTVGVINHEGARTFYQVEVLVNDTVIDTIGPFVLGDDGKHEAETKFVFMEDSPRQKVELYLYKYTDNEPVPYLEPLRLWVQVTRSL